MKIKLMKKLFLTGITALLLATGTAHAGFLTSMPPAEYDKPYMGELEIRRMVTDQDVRTLCPKAWKARTQTRFPACSMHNATRCEVYIVNDRGLKALGMNYALTLRHELAHCNGWPGDHPGGKKVPIDTRVEMPKLPASTRILPAYPPVVCVSPEWQPEPCKDRESKDIWATARPLRNSDIPKAVIK